MEAGHERVEGSREDGGDGGQVVFDSTDLETTEEFLIKHYAPLRIGSSTGRSGARITRVAGGAVSADEVALTFDMNYSVEPLGKICLCDIRTGVIDRHRPADWREAGTFGPGDLFSFAQPDRPYQGRARQARYSITMLDPALLNQVVGGEEQVRLLDHRPVDAVTAATLRRVIDHVRDDVLAAPGATASPLLVGAATRYLAAAVLAAFPTTAPVGPSAADSRDAHPRTVRRAVAFIEANAGRDLSAAEIAAAAHVTPRAIQLAFRRHLGTTPTAYLRRVRLDGARAQLLAAEPGSTTVTEVALRWGYSRPGVFSTHYREAHGEPPSRTLRGR
ncbi:helix-turn-helix domain-containing protein [Actinosynnema mirum]|uniref:Transcriptional regulator, AraC family n=1 Tax=Actinosynnema mirum (strain ATCC 29888 / DSM 43827 / JCM 3225 / NBRC 14064 / NCIMB 13271 / NRRL B-12336 / IMRU 3971 / 101) TaxID=446462 RepID=C6WIT0_ACTMD|nr:helix-turn-helix domain-containing protein [Actinosynnema mirum]ACU38170.1 transcriptional regulator, AraC family [Actinosynnema mirum DSM 43827]AXX31672.1 transcriptional regulator, AraC family [Actinosynnema pretiosum subsp. pretiosum]